MRLRLLLAGCLLVMSGVSCSFADDEKKDAPRDVEEPMLLEVGAEAPEFTLRDQNEEPVEFGEIIKKRKATAFVFYRSADW